MNIYTSACAVGGKQDMEIEIVSETEPDQTKKPLLLKNLAVTISYYLYSKVLYKYPENEGITISRKTRKTENKWWTSFYLLDHHILYDSHGRPAGNNGQ